MTRVGLNERRAKQVARPNHVIHRPVTIDPQAYLREALPGLFELGEKPKSEQLLNWLPDCWLLNRTRNTSIAMLAPA
ncbi:MAG: hypothetical protein C0467_20250 [Planctomycetaceae bacterium]|nr:hypothetical protein [Planctomycetaceae bacterium]